MAEHVALSERLVMAGFEYAFGISSADINGNGRLDLVAADTGVGLYWFENDGEGGFSQHIIHRRKDEWLERHAIADINGDGRPEIVIVDNINGCLLWFGYDGDPRKKKSWSHHYITEGGLPGAYDVTVADFDGDGDLDVAASSWVRGNQFAWFENRDGEWIKHLIEADMAETRTICAADVNGNGLVDLLGTASGSNQVVWYENVGDPANRGWRKHVIDTSPRPIHGHPVDMDGDGDVDVVMALGMSRPEQAPALEHHQVVWYENDGHPERGPWKKHVICECCPVAFEAVAADLDGDGQVEVAATSWGKDGSIALFKHGGDPRGPWSKQVLKAGWTMADQVFIADLDGDGWPDIVAAAERGSNELRWWRNEGGKA